MLGKLKRLIKILGISSPEAYEMINEERFYDIEDFMRMTHDSLLHKYPVYMERVDNTVPHACGNVLEIGCGVGNITRFLASSDNVKQRQLFH